MLKSTLTLWFCCGLVEIFLILPDNTKGLLQMIPVCSLFAIWGWADKRRRGPVVLLVAYCNFILVLCFGYFIGANKFSVGDPF